MAPEAASSRKVPRNHMRRQHRRWPLDKLSVQNMCTLLMFTMKAAQRGNDDVGIEADSGFFCFHRIRVRKESMVDCTVSVSILSILVLATATRKTPLFFKVTSSGAGSISIFPS